MSIDQIIRKHHKVLSEATILYALLDAARYIYWDSDYSAKEQEAAKKAINDIEDALKEIDAKELDQ